MKVTECIFKFRVFLHHHSLKLKRKIHQKSFYPPRTVSKQPLLALVTGLAFTLNNSAINLSSAQALGPGQGTEQNPSQELPKGPPKHEMHADRRLVGYFTEWRHGKNGLPAYLVSDIPWQYLTHINYAFAEVNLKTDEIDFSNRAAAIEMDFPCAISARPFKGHFNCLVSYKQQYPEVKTLIAVGGWAASRGFYTMTSSFERRKRFIQSAVAFIRKYEFDGIDLDYEYPTATSQAGNPDDFDVSQPRRSQLFEEYVLLVKELKQALIQAGIEDQRYYLLTAAVPASSWILGGMQLGQYLPYMDFINVMSYDFHGAWNGFVGHNAGIYPDDRDPETKPLGTPVLNADWSMRYYNGQLPMSKINLGVPYYSRGWHQVNPGQYPGGLYGRAPKTNGGAVGVDNIWHDKDAQGNEIGGGSNPLWHLRNLLSNPNAFSYADDWGFDPTTKGEYQSFQDTFSGVPYIWNEQKRVFLSYEDDWSMQNRLDYVQAQGIGGLMIWELAGDYDLKPNGEYGFGSSLTRMAYEQLMLMGPAKRQQSDLPLPKDFGPYVMNFRGNYDHPNYTYKWQLHNQSDKPLDPGWILDFSLPNTANLTSVWGASFQMLYAHENFKRYRIFGPSWQSLPAGGTVELQGMIKLNFSGGPLWVVLNNQRVVNFTPTQ